MSYTPPEAPPEQIVLDDFVLRRTRQDDAAILADSVAANLDRLLAWMPWATPEAGTLEAQQARIPSVLARWREGLAYEFMAISSETGEHLGTFGLERRIGPGALELGYWLCAKAEGHGYATRAARALTDAALRLPDVERVEIHCDEANLRSALIPQRLGFRLDRIEPDELQTTLGTQRSMIWVYQP